MLILAFAAVAAEPLVVGPVTDSTTPGEPATGNMLDNADVPPGTTASVTGFSVPGSDTVYPVGSVVPVVNPTTGLVTGTMTVNADGSYIFNPAPGYVGDVPPVTVNVASSDGQTAQVPLSLTVNEVLTDASESPTIVAGTGPLALNVLDNTDAPTGTATNVTSFTLPGSSVVYPAGTTPVTVVDPVTGKVTGTVVVEPDGDVIFTPAPGFTGQAPAISYSVESSDGQVSPGALTVTVLPGEGLDACGA
jgi:CshA-type fibril repeat protein